VGTLPAPGPPVTDVEVINRRQASRVEPVETCLLVGLRGRHLLAFAVRAAKPIRSCEGFVLGRLLAGETFKFGGG
jgi:hypothetical protein